MITFITILTFINIAFTIYFIYICFKAMKLIKVNMGLWATIVFVLGLLSFCGNQNSKILSTGSENEIVKHWKNDSAKSIDSSKMFHKDVEYEKDLFSRKTLMIVYGQEMNSYKYVPIKAYTNELGIVGGMREWEPTVIDIKTNKGNDKIQYNVIGILKWKLFNMPIYSMQKEYKGEFDIKK